MPLDPLELLAALPLPALLADPQGRVLAVNPPFTDLTQHPSPNSHPAPAPTSLHDLLGNPRPILAVPTSTHAKPYESHVLTADHQHLPVLIAWTPLHHLAPQHPTTTHRIPPDALLITLTDLTDLKQTALEVAHLSDTVIASAMKLQDDNAELERRVRRRTDELHAANRAAITMLAVASEARDQDTGAHVRRIQLYTHHLALHLGFTPLHAEALGRDAILHDVGKITVPDNILKKPGPLTPHERQRMQQHTTAGQAILADTPFFQTARTIARSHHERWDGRGYPDQHAATDIPLPARIVHVVDVFDALASDRVYKEAWPPARAVAQIKAGSGSDFDPDVVQAFLAMHDQGQLPQLANQAADHASNDPLTQIP